MKPVALVGVLLVVLGVVALVYQGVTYTTRDTVIDVGPVHATADRQHTLPLPPVLGMAAIAGGVALFLAARPRHTSRCHRSHSPDPSVPVGRPDFPPARHEAEVT